MSIRKRSQLEEISAASMSDLAFLLLVFFMVASVFYVREGLVSSLPKKNAQPKLVLRKNIYRFEIQNNQIQISNPGLGKKTYKSIQEFREALKDEIQIENIHEKYAVISAFNTNVQTLVSVLSSVKEKGFKNISLQKSLK
ncbi:MAG: biopolymer transporter ExbD [Leptospiraceae bacterium]|nr:biopolymer transporter ExbD [Leptospiraceae bacterium]MDW7977136.1 biopolymer transporter ExbD [Leptospiraceae bacterium]